MLAENTVIGQVFTNFWAIVSTVVAFYFAARVVDTKTLSKDTDGSDGAPSIPDKGTGSETSQAETK